MRTCSAKHFSIPPVGQVCENTLNSRQLSCLRTCAAARPTQHPRCILHSSCTQCATNDRAKQADPRRRVAYSTLPQGTRRCLKGTHPAPFMRRSRWASARGHSHAAAVASMCPIMCESGTSSRKGSDGAQMVQPRDALTDPMPADVVHGRRTMVLGTRPRSSTRFRSEFPNLSPCII
jgi:hypothetical protein